LAPELILQNELLSYHGEPGWEDLSRIVAFARNLAKLPNGKRVGAAAKTYCALPARPALKMPSR
jgi:hypothetical protein